MVYITGWGGGWGDCAADVLLAARYVSGRSSGGRCCSVASDSKVIAAVAEVVVSQLEVSSPGDLVPGGGPPPGPLAVRSGSDGYRHSLINNTSVLSLA